MRGPAWAELAYEKNLWRSHCIGWPGWPGGIFQFLRRPREADTHVAAKHAHAAQRGQHPLMPMASRSIPISNPPAGPNSPPPGRSRWPRSSRARIPATPWNSSLIAASAISSSSAWLGNVAGLERTRHHRIRRHASRHAGANRDGPLQVRGRHRRRQRRGTARPPALPHFPHQTRGRQSQAPARWRRTPCRAPSS
jgi:hypothetical protein